MHAPERQNGRPELKEIVLEASRALAHLDADRLEELAASCRTLNRPPTALSPAERERLSGEARAGVREMEVFGQVLAATRANLRVLQRLRELRAERLEYTPPVLPD